jgi:hypothetical protein
MRILGWVITGFAISLGAPFWFDLLNKIMVVRSTVKPHQKSPEESSEDRQNEREPVRVAAVVGVPSSATPSVPPATHSAGGAWVNPGRDYQPQEWASGHPESGIL